MRIALAQIDCKLGDLEANLQRAHSVIAQVSGEADLIVFPELSLSGYAVGASDRRIALRAEDPALAELAAAAGERALLIGFPELGRGGRVYNSAAFFDCGQLVYVHRKLYLPTYNGFEERKHFSAGANMRAFDTRFGRCATLICNDAWQPALAFVACQDGAELMLFPTCSSHSDPDELDVRSYWHDICRLYARLYQCYIVFVNRVGEEHDARFWGGSRILDPAGEVVVQASEDDEHILVSPELDLADVVSRRHRLPFTREARLSLMRRELTRLIDEGGDL